MSVVFMVISVFISAGVGIFLDKDKIISDVWLLSMISLIVITFWDYGIFLGLLYTFIMIVVARIVYQGIGKNL